MEIPNCKREANPTDLARMFGVSRPTIYSALKACRFRTMRRAATKWQVSVDEVDEMLGMPGRAARLSAMHSLLCAQIEVAFKRFEYHHARHLLKLAERVAFVVVNHEYTQNAMVDVHDYCKGDDSLFAITALADDLLGSTLQWAVTKNKKVKL